MFSFLLVLATCGALALAEQPSLQTEDGHVFITSQGVRQNVTDLLGQTAANEIFAAHAATVQMVNKSVHTLDQSLTPRLKDVERKSVKSVADLVAELIDGNKQMASAYSSGNKDIVGEIASLRKQLGATDTTVKPGVVQFVTNCVPSGSCSTTSQDEINAVIAGPAFEDVAGIYTCAFTNPAKKVLSSPAMAKGAGPPGFAVITCKTPKHAPEYVTAKQFTSTVAITQNGDTLKFGGKVGRNAVKFHATPPTITGAPTDLVTAKISTNSGKFSFKLTIRDADTAQKDIKISAAASNTKFMPASGISVSQPTADGTRVISVTPNLKEKPKKNTQYKITVSAEDKYGLKATPVVVVVEMKVDAVLLKICTSGGGRRDWMDSGFWDNQGGVEEGRAKDMASAIAARTDIKTAEYSLPLGPGLAIKAYVGTTMVGEAYYKIDAKYQQVSLRELLSQSKYTNANIGTKDTGKSSSGTPIRSKYLNQGNNAHDMFIDTRFPLRVRHRGFCGANDNWARLSTDAQNLCSNGGHTFGGIGGTHRHGSWQVDYEAAPTTGYCAPTNKYGTNYRHRHSSHYVYSSCGGARKQTNLDYIISRA